METQAAAPIATPDLTTGHMPAAPLSKSHAHPQSETSVEAPADFRLIIDRDEATGAYIYTTIDRRTGKIVQRLPREALLKMGDDQQYASGQLIRAKA
jgi:uncharacterized FlaG/YvyC family protein